jgi:hypothetical protein
MNWISRNNEWYLMNTSIYIKYESLHYTVVKDGRDKGSFKTLEIAQGYAENLNK